jgi:hypothetical protein
MLTRIQHALRIRQIWFLYKTLNRMYAMLILYTALDITITGVRRIRHDAKRDQFTSLCNWQCLLDAAMELRFSLNFMITRQDKQYRIGIRPTRQNSRRGYRRCGIARKGLKHDMGRPDTGGTALLSDQKAMFRIGNNNRRRCIGGDTQ